MEKIYEDADCILGQNDGNILDAVFNVDVIQLTNQNNWNSVEGIRPYETTCVFRHWENVRRILLKQEVIDAEIDEENELTLF